MYEFNEYYEIKVCFCVFEEYKYQEYVCISVL